MISRYLSAVTSVFLVFSMSIWFAFSKTYYPFSSDTSPQSIQGSIIRRKMTGFMLPRNSAIFWFEIGPSLSSFKRAEATGVLTIISNFLSTFNSTDPKRPKKCIFRYWCLSLYLWMNKFAMVERLPERGSGRVGSENFTGHTVIGKLTQFRDFVSLFLLSCTSWRISSRRWL